MSHSQQQNQSERWIETRPAMSIQGVGVRTTNEAEAGQQGKIPQLWDRYFQSGCRRNYMIRIKPSMRCTRITKATRPGHTP